jgi:putative Mg2+ transporter-C (MgtC) family protein
MLMQIVDWGSLLKIGIAFVAALPVGWERERHERSAGLRTFPLVAVSTCGFMLVAHRAFGSIDAESRTMQGLIAGIGFIGAGTIMKVQHTVRGTATAASLLVTAIIGMAVAYGLYDLVVVLSGLSLFTLRAFTAWRLIREDQPPPKNHESR